MTSQINPNNINGAYPVAGQDNNSQGFRDNFTNTGTNFAYAAAEITDLQNKAVLKAALTGTTLNNDMGGSILSNAQLQNMTNTVVSLGTLSGTVGVNYTAGSYQTVTTNGPITIAFTNFTAAGTEDYVVVQITVTDVSHTVTLPSAVGYGASSTSELGIQGLDTITNIITFAATGTYVYSFTTTDAGSTIYINDLTQSRSNFSGNVTLGNVSITATTAANTTTSGALTVAGGVGVAGNLYVGGNIVGNIIIDNIESITGNVTAGNLLTGGQVSATANITSAGNVVATGNLWANGGHLRTTATTANIFQLISTTINMGGQATTINIGNTVGNVNFAANTVTTGTITGGNVLTGGQVSAAGNVAGSNYRASGFVSATGNSTAGNMFSNGILSRYLDVEVVNFANITATNTYSLSTTSSINVLVANNTGYTATLNMPATPVDGQICNFSISGNTVTLAAGTGTVLPTYAGSTTAGTGYRYVYRTSTTSWYRIG